MSQKVKFYLGDDIKSLQEHMENEKISCFSNIVNNFYNIFMCF